MRLPTINLTHVGVHKRQRAPNRGLQSNPYLLLLRFEAPHTWTGGFSPLPLLELDSRFRPEAAVQAGRGQRLLLADSRSCIRQPIANRQTPDQPLMGNHLDSNGGVDQSRAHGTAWSSIGYEFVNLPQWADEFVPQ